MNSTETQDSPVKRANKARNAAIETLIKLHIDEWNEILLKERQDRGLQGLPGQRPRPLKDQLDEAKSEIARLSQIIEEARLQMPTELRDRLTDRV